MNSKANIEQYSSIISVMKKNILEITNNNVLSKRQIKSPIQKAITQRNWNNMLSLKKGADRVSENSSDNNYLDRMGLTHSRIWIRYRARAIKGIGVNHKRSWKNYLDCRFCDDKILETQEHLGECRGLSWERRNLKMDTEGSKINFFKRVEKKLGWSSTSPVATATTWFINFLPLLLNLVFHNRILFDCANFLTIIMIIRTNYFLV